MRRVLFVCLGNICRSPTAEGVFRKLVADRGLAANYEIDSAGTSGWHAGEPPDPRSQEEARRHGIDMSGQRSRAVTAEDFERFDYIVAMDHANLRELRKRCPEHLRDRLHRLTAFAPELGVQEVPDPYYGQGDGFATVFSIVATSAARLLETIERERAAG
ncbi:MAG: low molecular weight phosphotyrosine protein phosphatase [Candidatus Hydrogenedentes bacterium]|nr:low molecular weight phosphotyrosine protein phosphatase [Candidatus Hydrogenedentota bacterium]